MATVVGHEDTMARSLVTVLLVTFGRRRHVWRYVDIIHGEPVNWLSPVFTFGQRQRFVDSWLTPRSLVAPRVIRHSDVVVGR